MKTIRKTNKKATYFKGNFCLRNENENWAFPIDFPTVFTAFGAAIKSGNWQSFASINTPEYVINNYFDGHKGNLAAMWDKCSQLENITWEDVRNNKDYVLSLINAANNELLRLPEL